MGKSFKLNSIPCNLLRYVAGGKSTQRGRWWIIVFLWCCFSCSCCCSLWMALPYSRSLTCSARSLLLFIYSVSFFLVFYNYPLSLVSSFFLSYFKNYTVFFNSLIWTTFFLSSLLALWEFLTVRRLCVSLLLAYDLFPFYFYTSFRSSSSSLELIIRGFNRDIFSFFSFSTSIYFLRLKIYSSLNLRADEMIWFLIFSGIAFSIC